MMTLTFARRTTPFGASLDLHEARTVRTYFPEYNDRKYCHGQAHRTRITFTVPEALMPAFISELTGVMRKAWALSEQR